MRNLTGPPGGSENRGVVLDPNGDRVEVEVTAVPLKQGEQFCLTIISKKTIKADYTRFLR